MQFLFKKSLNYLFIIFLSIFALSGCTQKFSDSFSTLNASLDSFVDIELTPEQLIKLPYNSAYVRLNDGKQVLMILALIEENKINRSQRLKWVSSDNLMIITENGRIIKTQGFDDDLMSISPSLSMRFGIPLLSVSNKTTGYYDWAPNYRYQFSAEVSSNLIGQELKTLQSWSVPSTHLTETVIFLELETNITNHYWLNENNKVISSIQYLGPNMGKIEMSFVKDFIPQ